MTSGLLTHNVITQLKVCNHQEVLRLSIISMPYPVLLGLDWLKQHNPTVDWTRGQLLLSCCGANHDFLVTAFGQGYSPLKPDTHSTPSIGFLGLGLGLPRMPTSDICKLLDLPNNKKRLTTSYISTNPNAPASILHPPIWNGISQEELLAIWSTPPPEPDSIYGSKTKPLQIAYCSSNRFQKYAKNQAIFCIWYTMNEELKVRINAISNSLPPDTTIPVSPPPESLPSTPPTPHTSDRAFVLEDRDEICKLVPEQYHTHLDVFDSIEVKKLPDH
ncbi:hypothetical protein C0992_005158 [Termitomyces sp. T32_za158]|nr:hypothetical protein C0992_005158 [Termitomyces sp. T32_za158]